MNTYMNTKMKIATTTLVALTFVAAETCLAAEPVANGKGSGEVTVTRSSGFFDGMWGKMRQMMPKKGAEKRQSTAVMGVRGSETTESALNPYWAGDLTSDPKFQSELSAFDQARDECEQGDASKGAAALEALMLNSTQKLFRPNYLLSLSACFQKLGNAEKSDVYLKSFVSDYPDHPLAAEAKAELARH